MMRDVRVARSIYGVETNEGGAEDSAKPRRKLSIVLARAS